MASIEAEVTEKIPADDLRRENPSSAQPNIKRKSEEPRSLESAPVCPLKTIKMDAFKVPMLPSTAKPKATVNKAAVESAPPKSASDEKEKKFNWRQHFDFWSKVKISPKECPKCRRHIGPSESQRRTHYMRFHYDTYYSIIGQRKTESWIGQRLGSNSIYNQRTKRVCLHCDATMTAAVYGSRFKLLTHIEREHPEEFSKLKAEYVEIQSSGQVKDTDVHNLLTSVTSSLSSEPEELPKPQIAKKLNRYKPFLHSRLEMFTTDFHAQPAPEGQKPAIEPVVTPCAPQLPLYSVPQPLIFLPSFPIIAQFPSPILFAQNPFVLLPTMYPIYGIPPTMALPNLFSPNS